MANNEQSDQPFSVRSGLKPAPSPQTDRLDAPTRNRLWNVLHKHFFREVRVDGPFGTTESVYDGGEDRFHHVWDSFFQLQLTGYSEDNLRRAIENAVVGGSLAQVFDLIEFIIRVACSVDFERPFKGGKQIEPAINAVLQQRLVSWRLVNGQFINNTNRVEVASIEQAMKDRTPNVQKQLAEAIVAMRENRYGDSIKKSISAIETLLKSIGGEHGKDLGDNLEIVKKKLNLPMPLKHVIEKLYAWSSATPGIRHGDKPDAKAVPPQSADAMFALVTCSAVINYLSHLNDLLKAG